MLEDAGARPEDAGAGLQGEPGTRGEWRCGVTVPGDWSRGHRPRLEVDRWGAGWGGEVRAPGWSKTL